MLTSVSISRPAFTSRSMASLALASPVESSPITTHSPLASAASASSMAKRHFNEFSSCLKNAWCAPQKDLPELSQPVSCMQTSKPLSSSSHHRVA